MLWNQHGSLCHVRARLEGMFVVRCWSVGVCGTVWLVAKACDSVWHESHHEKSCSKAMARKSLLFTAVISVVGIPVHVPAIFILDFTTCQSKILQVLN